jgi:formate hydrogenlyase transcriptional activator
MKIRNESEVTASRYRLLLEIVQAANSHLDLVRVLEAITTAVRPVVHVDGAVVLTRSRDGLVRPASVFISPEASAPPAPPSVLEYPTDVPDEVPGLPFEGSLPEHVLDTRATLLCPDVAGQFPFNDREPLLRHGVRSGVCVPLFARGEFLGCVFYARLEPPAFETADAQLLEELTGPIVTALANVLAYRELELLRRALARHNRVLRDEVEERGMFSEIVGRSSGLENVLRRVERVASSETTVLILGETGTGKELIARAIHARSPRSDRPLVSVNCAALAPGLVASELFGHERGSFTGATQRRVGRFELAAGGTLFLDEIGELPPEVQVALLRVLQEREYERVGGDRPVQADVRVLAATHRDLRAAVAAGSFREDLYYRLSVFPIVLPPLRERRQDIPELIEHFGRIHGSRRGLQYVGVEPESLSLMLRYDWPGNVRELENVVERATILSDGGALLIEESSLAPPDPVRTGGKTWIAPETAASGDLRAGIRALEIQLIKSALQQSQGRVAGRGGAAGRLGIPPATLDNKIRLYRIDKSQFLPKP